VDVAVFEVGIGGRLDSTNVLDTSQSVITAVQMDHAGVLGGTRTKIATEKAGIFKTDVDALVAPGVPWDVVKVVFFIFYK
jgi:dihydrofolate synthase/folylpolyglutamate synthase